MIQALKALHSILISLALYILLTGGTVFQFPEATLELNRIEFFMTGAAITGWLLLRRSAKLPVSETALNLVSRPTGALILIISVGVLLWLAHLFRHWGMVTHAYDTAFVHQALKFWMSPNLLHCDLCIGGSYLGEHASFSFLTIAPLIQLLKADEWIFAIQFIALFLPTILLITHGPVKNQKSFWIVAIVAFISFRAFRNSMIWDFREDHLAFAFLSFSLLALYNHRLISYFVCITAAMLSKENVGAVTLLFGIAVLFTQQLPFVSSERRKIGAATAALSLVYLVVAWGTLMPQFTSLAPQASNLVQRFPGMGATDREVIQTLLTSPDAWWKLTSWILFQGSSFKYIALCLLPFIYFFRFTPFLFLPVASGMLMNLVSNATTQRSMQFHYELVFLPFLMFGFLLGLKKWSEKQSVVISSEAPGEVSLLSPKLLLPLSLALVTFGKSPVWEVRTYWPDISKMETSFFLRAFKTQTVVAADDTTLAQLTHLPSLRRLVFPDTLPEHESVLQSVLSLSNKDRTGLEQHSVKNARVWVFSKLHPLSDRLSLEMDGAGWSKISKASLPLAEIWISPD